MTQTSTNDFQHRLLTALVDTNHANHSTAVIYAVYKTVLANKAITLTKLKWVLDKYFKIPEMSVTTAYLNLVNPDYSNGLKPFKSKYAVHLHAKPEFEENCLKMEADIPELLEFIPPKIKVISA
jgi:hypothetical protein